MVGKSNIPSERDMGKDRWRVRENERSGSDTGDSQHSK